MFYFCKRVFDEAIMQKIDVMLNSANVANGSHYCIFALETV